jgi:broad specificity phosphatase PhoE
VDPSRLADPERYVKLPVPGAEPPETVVARGAALWRERAPGAGEHLWVVAHGGSLRALVAVARGWTLAEAFRVVLPPGGWLVVDTPDRRGIRHAASVARPLDFAEPAVPGG